MEWQTPSFLKTHDADPFTYRPRNRTFILHNLNNYKGMNVANRRCRVNFPKSFVLALCTEVEKSEKGGKPGRPGMLSYMPINTKAGAIL